VQRIHLAIAEGHEADAGEADQLVEGGNVFLVAGEAIERLGKDNIHLAAAHCRLQRLVTGSEGGRAGDGGVVKAVNHGPALTFGKGAADAELVLDRMLGLPVTRVPGVESAAGGHAKGFPVLG
jgi:hypothetical protein